MKNTFAKWGAAALALALVFAFASCAQPTEETSSGPATPTIIRLHLDKQETVDFRAVTFEIRVAEELYVPTGYGNYPYAPLPGQNDGKTSNQAINTVDPNDRTKVLAIPGDPPQVPALAGTRTAAIAQSVLQQAGKKKFLASGILTAVAGAAQPGQAVGGAAIQTDNDDKTQRYIDIELVDLKPSSPGYGSVYSGSISGYVELAVTGAAAGFATSGVQANTAYLYTKDKHGFNDFLRLATQADVDAGAANNIGEPVYGVKNSNIKKVSLKSGVNDLYLSFFSYARNNY
ncbi:MAG: hypothetical protein LBG57_08965 [Treponema sp.]|nr:hypothetical protein [Treponema sp.]